MTTLCQQEVRFLHRFHAKSTKLWKNSNCTDLLDTILKVGTFSGRVFDKLPPEV